MWSTYIPLNQAECDRIEDGRAIYCTIKRTIKGWPIKVDQLMPIVRLKQMKAS